MIGSDDEDDHQDHGSMRPDPTLSAPAEEAAATFDLLVEEIPRGAAPGTRPVRTPLVQLKLTTPPPSPDDRCVLPQPFQALTLRMIMAPSPAGPQHPPGLVQDFDKKVDKIRQLSSFECRVVGGPSQAHKLAGFLAHLTDRNKAAKLKGDGWLPGTYAFLTPQPLGPGETVWLHQFVPPAAAPPAAAPAPLAVVPTAVASNSGVSESKKRPRSPPPSSVTTTAGAFVPHSPDSVPPTDNAAMLPVPASPPGLPSASPPSPPGFPRGHSAASASPRGAAAARTTAVAGGQRQQTNNGKALTRPPSPPGLPPPRPPSPQGYPPGHSAPPATSTPQASAPVAFAPHSPESAPPVPPLSSSSSSSSSSSQAQNTTPAVSKGPSDRASTLSPSSPLPSWSMGRPPSPEYAPPGWEGPPLQRGELPPPFTREEQPTLPQRQQPQQQLPLPSSSSSAAVPPLQPSSFPAPPSSIVSSAAPVAGDSVRSSVEVVTPSSSAASSSSWGSDQQTAANAYSKLVRTQDTMALSRMYHMRRLNNCIKDALLGGAVRLGAGTRKWGQLTNNPAALLPPPQQHPSSGAGSSASAAAASGGLRVLDLACGKAGDLQKWNKAAKCVPGGLQRYVGVDIARGSLDDALERIQEFGLAGQKSNGSGSTVRLALVNLGESKMEETPSEVWEGSAPVPQWCNAPALTRATDCLFHVASMQFALHYMFESLNRARGFFQDLGSWLAPGGCFVCTTVDARVMVDLLMEQAQPEWKDGEKQWVLRIYDPRGSNSGAAAAALAAGGTVLQATLPGSSNISAKGLPPPPDDASSRLQRLQARDRLYRSTKKHYHCNGKSSLQVDGSAEIAPKEAVSSNTDDVSSISAAAVPGAAAAGVGGGAASAIDAAEASSLAKTEDDVTSARKQALCTITFADDVYQRLLKPSGEHSAPLPFSNVAGKRGAGTSLSDQQLESMLGLRYAFKLFDGEDAAAVDAPEWLVPLPLLTTLAGEAGLDLDFATNFQDYVRSGAAWNLQQGNWAPAVPAASLATFGVFNHRGTLSGPEWATSRLYQVLQFTKRAPAPTSGAAAQTGTAQGGGGGGGVSGGSSNGSSSSQMSEGQLRMAAMKAVKAALGPEGFKTLGALGQKQAIQSKIEELKAAQEQ